MNALKAATAPQPIETKLDLLLSRLHGVRATGDGRWLAKCPAHNDRSPSLSIKVIDNKILIRDLAGCGTESVLGSIALTFADLFPDKITPQYHGVDGYDRYKAKKSEPRFSRFELFPKLVLESCILHTAIGDLLAGKPLSDNDLARVQQAMATIWALRGEADR